MLERMRLHFSELLILMGKQPVVLSRWARAKALLTIACGITLLPPLPCQAQRVEQTKADRVLIQTDMLKFQPGQRWEAIDGNGVIIGVVEILQVKDPRAVAILKEGDVIVGANLRLKQDLKGPQSEEEKIRKRRWFIGPSLLQASILTTVNLIETTMTGQQWGLQFGADQVLTAHQALRLRAGFDLIHATGPIDSTTECGGDGQCSLWTHYLTGSLGFLFQAMPEGHAWNIGLSSGFAGFLPVSRDSDALNAGKLALDGGLEIGLQANFKTNPITWLEFSAQRVFLRDTATVRPSLTRYNVTWIQNF